CTAPAVSITSIAPQCASNGSVTLSASLPGGTFSGPGVSGNTFSPSVAGPGTHTITYTVCSAVATTTVTVSASPSNDGCANATAIGCNSSVTGSTLCATVDAGLPFCGTTGGTAPGVWYSFTGNGGFASLSTCNAATNYDTKLHVFTGNCGALTCVAGNDDYSSTTQTCSFSSLRSIVEFCTTPGETYYVLVHGFSSGSGNFQLDLTCAAPLTVDAGACQTRFVGYTGPGAPDDTLYICPTISGGSGAYTTSISPAAAYTCQNGCFAVAPNATTTYTITVTDAQGCSTSDDVTVNYLDVVAACGSNGQPKVQICHVPPGNPGNANTLCVSPNAVPAHLGAGIGHGGDYLGPCGNTCRRTNPSCAPESCGGLYTITISGTGYLDEMSWSFGGTTGGPYAFGSSNTVTVNVPSGTSTFTLETQGTFNDNVANYTISCGGGVVATGTVLGGQTKTITNICCSGVIAPKMGDEPQASMSTGGIMAFPNPFTETTTFRFRSSKNGLASVTIFTLTGKQVATVFNGEVASQGVYEVPFNAQGLSAGVYLYRYMNAEGQVSMGKVNLVK
ncbi:MAG TPA: T9SS type A sorting domain-containing protein, partial [Bacteroidia bacterium]|nr:T9SS type A sorting domain-containing protein [Bacteroidia bacterium]